MNSPGPQAHTPAAGERIVVGYVDTQDCQVAIDAALQHACRRPDSTVYIVRAIPVAEHVEISVLDEAFEKAREETMAAVLEACEGMAAPPLPVHLDVSFGDPAETIAAAAQRIAATLVIIGHGSEGAVAQVLARRLRCPLHVATSDRYSAPPEPQPRLEPATPDDPDRHVHTYRPDDVFEQSTYHIGPTRIY